MYSYGPPHMAKQKQDDQLEHTYSSYVRIRDVALNTCQKRWMIGRSGSGISALVARHDDDDDDIFLTSKQYSVFSFFVSTLGPNHNQKEKRLENVENEVTFPTALLLEIFNLLGSEEKHCLNEGWLNFYCLRWDIFFSLKLFSKFIAIEIRGDCLIIV